MDKQVTSHEPVLGSILDLDRVVTPSAGLRFAVILFLVYVGIHVVYNLYLHPLRNYPGPFLARSTLLWRFYHSVGGRYHRRVTEQHKKYGPIVRLAPNELSFASVESWKDIYGHAIGKRQTCIKSEFYDVFGGGFNSTCIGSERNPKEHARMRKSLSAAFSTKALLEQEEIVNSNVDAFVRRLGTDGGPGSQGLNMTKWFEMVAFDILGEMSFGESFGSVAQGHPHFWSEMFTEHLFAITVVDMLRRYPLFVTLGKLALPLTTALREKHTALSREKVARRLNSKNPRADFMSRLISKVESGEMEMEELTAHASTLTVAGGETVATSLAATTYYLLHTPHTLARLQDEIRGCFATYSDITSTRAQQLPYLQAVISEGLRIFPPGSRGFPRVSPGTEISGHYIPAGVEVYTTGWTMTHDEKYFHDPFTFKPERWLDPDCKDVKEASQPFSLGPRGCIGQNFASLELNLILSKLIWSYDMEALDKNLDWEANSHEHVMWTKPELKVVFTPVQRSVA
ncbi:putative cytochrome P450 [Hypoxylon sp. NC1633]|nr:putative cytochrome P450 [Hypoxylon sp. NC1633]